MVGPGVKHGGIDERTWADHVDTRATMLALLGLQDDYAHDGRIIAAHVEPSSLPAPIKMNFAAYEALAAAYKQLTAPFGAASMAGLQISTTALRSGDAAYAAYVKYLDGYLAARDPLIARIKSALNDAAAGQRFSASEAASMTREAKQLTAGIVAAAKVPK